MQGNENSYGAQSAQMGWAHDWHWLEGNEHSTIGDWVSLSSLA